MSAVLAITRKDLRQRLRDRSAFIIFLLAPLVVVGLMGLGVLAHEPARPGSELWILDGGPAAVGLESVLSSPELSDTDSGAPTPTAEAAREAVDNGQRRCRRCRPRRLHGVSRRDRNPAFADDPQRCRPRARSATRAGRHAVLRRSAQRRSTVRPARRWLPEFLRRTCRSCWPRPP
ncbi:hypothetical protein ACU686_09340 [Yinghuangia aomiensis]